MYLATLLSTAAILYLPLLLEAGIVQSRGLCLAEPPAEFVKAASKLYTTKNHPSQQAAAVLSPLTNLAVKVYMHVVSTSTALSGGNIPDSQITAQFNRLRDSFLPYNITFINGGFDRTINTSWSTDVTGAELQMKRVLRKGTYKDLNLYIIKQPRNNALGYCTFPGNVGTNTDSFFRDGCTVRYDSVPGGTAYQYNQGKTAVHETGHWFGLLHTFNGGSCTGTGDLIVDTPQQLSATSGCPTRRDSCPSQPGLDPINNYMDYSIDSCYTGFTPGQKVRMFDMSRQYRGY